MRDRKWTVSLILLFVLFLFVLVRFQMNAKNIENAVQDLQMRDHDEKDAWHFVLVAQEFDNPYWKKVENGAKDAAEKYGIELEYVAPLRTSLEEQIKLLEKAIASQADGIIVQSLNEEAFTPVINKAISKNIPVITIDTDASTSHRKAYVGTDNYAAGKQLGKVVAEMTGGTGKIGVIIGSKTSEGQNMRLNGFLSVTHQYPDLEVIDVLPSNISKIQASLQAERMLRKNKDISIMVGTSALDAVGILNAVRNLHLNHVKIFGFDDVEETLQAVEDGTVQATVIQKPYDMGFQSVGLLYDSFHGRAIRKENFTMTEVVMKQGVQQEEQQ